MKSTIADQATVLDKIIRERLNTPAARRTRYLAALSNANPVIKIRWDNL